MSQSLDPVRVLTNNEDGSITFSAERYLSLGYIYDEAGARVAVVAGPLPTNKAGKIEPDAIRPEGTPIGLLLVSGTWSGF